MKINKNRQPLQMIRLRRLDTAEKTKTPRKLREAFLFSQTSRRLLHRLLEGSFHHLGKNCTNSVTRHRLSDATVNEKQATDYKSDYH